MNSLRDMKSGQEAIVALRNSIAALKRIPSVLVVEDSPSDTELLLTSFDGYNVVVEKCATGKDALYAIRSKHIDVVLLDFSLPGDIDGLDLLKAVRQIPQFIIVTGSTDPEKRQEALRLGALDVWQKPVTKDQLAQVFERIA